MYGEATNARSHNIPPMKNASAQINEALDSILSTPNESAMKIMIRNIGHKLSSAAGSLSNKC
ncbi:hypothetical protein OUHCRE19_28090 [Enterobacter asburiae]